MLHWLFSHNGQHSLSVLELMSLGIESVCALACRIVLIVLWGNFDVSNMFGMISELGFISKYLCWWFPVSIILIGIFLFVDIHFLFVFLHVYSFVFIAFFVCFGPSLLSKIFCIALLNTEPGVFSISFYRMQDLVFCIFHQ